MKKTFLLIFVCTCLAVNAQSKPATAMVKLTKTKSLKMGEKQLQVAKEKASYYLNVKNGMVYPAKGFVLYTTKTDKGTTFIVPVKSSVNRENVVAMPVPQWALVTANKELMVVCSCGSNIVNQEGDMCRWNDSSERCEGECVGGQSGKSCGITTMSMTTGKIIYNHNNGR